MASQTALPVSTTPFNPNAVDLTTADPRDIVCFLSGSQNEYNGNIGARVSALFVILIVSTLATFFPVLAKRVPRLRIPLYVYLFARYFGAGVIVATAFIHLLDPAYAEIGPQTCVGMTGGWADYSWCPALVLTSVMVVFLLDFGAERYVEMRYGMKTEQGLQAVVTTTSGQALESDGDQEEPVSPHPDTIVAADPTRGAQSASQIRSPNALTQTPAFEKKFIEDYTEFDDDPEFDEARRHSFQQQIAAFLILEFGVIFHSVIIGLNLGVVGDEFATLYPVLVFHQSFEGLGIGARMSAIPFKRGSWLPWVLCAAYGLTTPISIAVGLGLRTTYNPGSFTANVVSGVLDALSAGILIYTGLVELLARDFLFNPLRTRDNARLAFMLVCVFAGAGLMALLGKWA